MEHLVHGFNSVHFGFAAILYNLSWCQCTQQALCFLHHIILVTAKYTCTNKPCIICITTWVSKSLRSDNGSLCPFKVISMDTLVWFVVVDIFLNFESNQFVAIFTNIYTNIVIGFEIKKGIRYSLTCRTRWVLSVMILYSNSAFLIHNRISLIPFWLSTEQSFGFVQHGTRFSWIGTDLACRASSWSTGRWRSCRRDVWGAEGGRSPCRCTAHEEPTVKITDTDILVYNSSFTLQ